jgi:hypothetical protein
MTEVKHCRVCGDSLVVEENMTLRRVKDCNWICTTCNNARIKRYRAADREKAREYNRKYYGENREKMQACATNARRRNGIRSFKEDKNCALYLGVHIAERVLKNVFKNVKPMPAQNPGYDFICNKGKKIDVKSSCLHLNRGKRSGWGFTISHNKIADYFLCLAFDSRETLNPLHIWLIPGGVVNNRASISISLSTVHKWDECELEIDRVVACCNIMKGG